MLENEEYVEQAFLFNALAARLESGESLQDLLLQIRDEILTTTKLPMAIDFISSELNHVGIMSTAMLKLPHYFNPFQTYLIGQAESDSGRFDLRTALAILEKDSLGKAERRLPVATFFFQFESLCRNRLQYDYGLSAMAYDPVFDDRWREWLLDMRRKIGTVELADLVFIHSEHYAHQQIKKGVRTFEIAEPVLFGEKEGKIALANRRKDALFFFSALQRQLKYPPVPRVQLVNESADMVPKMARQMERLEVRIKLLEDEQRGQGIDLTKYYQPPE